MGNLIIQKNTLTSNRATKALYNSSCYIKSLLPFFISWNISDNTKHSLVMKCNLLICQPYNFAACIFIANGSFPWINAIQLRSTDNQWQPNTAVAVWQMRWKVRQRNTHACTWCNDRIFITLGWLLPGRHVTKLHHKRRHPSDKHSLSMLKHWRNYYFFLL